HRELRDGWPMRASDLLDRQQDFPALGWEWHYLKRRCHGELLSFQGGYCLAWSPDGRWIACGRDGRIGLHDPASGSLEKTVRLGRGSVRHLSFSRDGRLLAVSSWEGFAIVELPSGEVRHRLKETERVYGEHLALCFSPDGKVLASLVPAKGVQLWETATGKAGLLLSDPAVGKTDHHRGRSLAWSPDGKILAVGTNYGRILLWDAETGKKLSHLEPAPPDTKFESVAFLGSAGVVCCLTDKGTFYRLADDPATRQITRMTGGGLPPPPHPP